MSRNFSAWSLPPSRSDTDLESIVWVVRFKTGDGAQEVEVQDVIAAAGIRSRRLTKQDWLQLVLSPRAGSGLVRQASGRLT